MTNENAPERKGWLSSLMDPPQSVAAIIIFLSVIQICAELASLAQLRRVWRLFELSPALAHRAFEQGAYIKDLIAPLLGHMFFHVNVQHFLVNIIAILCAGAFVQSEIDAEAGERKSDAAASFIAFFVLCGMFAGTFYVFAFPKSFLPIIGASGAAAGLLGAAVWIFFMNGGASRYRVLWVALVSVVIMGTSIILDTSKASITVFGSISAWPVHVGGYLFGLFTYPFFERLARGN